MSMLKTLDAEGRIAEPSTAVAPAPEEVRAAAEKAIIGELHRLDDAYAVVTRRAQARAEAAEAALATLQRTHDELVSRHAEAQRKLDLVHELKAKLDAL